MSISLAVKEQNGRTHFISKYTQGFFGVDMAVSRGISVGESLFFSYQIEGAAVQTHEAEYWICLLHEQIGK